VFNKDLNNFINCLLSRH